MQTQCVIVSRYEGKDLNVPLRRFINGLHYYECLLGMTETLNKKQKLSRCTCACKIAINDWVNV